MSEQEQGPSTLRRRYRCLLCGGRHTRDSCPSGQQAARMRALVVKHRGHLEGIGRVLGVTREAVRQAIKRFGLAELADAERAQRAAARQAEREAAELAARVRVCVWCGDEFEAVGGAWVTCSEECANEHRLRRAREGNARFLRRRGRPVGVRTCSACGGAGHNSRTCARRPAEVRL